jgi:hypothetical protein
MRCGISEATWEPDLEVSLNLSETLHPFSLDKRARAARDLPFEAGLAGYRPDNARHEVAL